MWNWTYYRIRNPPSSSDSEYTIHLLCAHRPKPVQERFFLTHYCGIVCTPTGIISTAGLINTGSLKETEGSQENPPAHSRGDTEQHMCDSLLLLLHRISNQSNFTEIHTKINNYHKTKQMAEWDHCQDRCGSSLTGTLGLAFCSPPQQARPLAHTPSALLALSCPLSRPRRLPTDQEDAAARQKGSATLAAWLWESPANPQRNPVPC